MRSAGKRVQTYGSETVHQEVTSDKNYDQSTEKDLVVKPKDTLFDSSNPVSNSVFLLGNSLTPCLNSMGFHKLVPRSMP